jgi:RNA polymerase sigma-70 factor (ECF subfamily)
MKTWLSRAVASTVVRGEETPAVDDARFQDADDPCPRHWREFPEPWPPVNPAYPAVGTILRDTIRELPGTWQEVVRQRDVEGRGAGEVSRDLGLTVEQHRAMLNRARAVLRERLARSLNRAETR